MVRMIGIMFVFRIFVDLTCTPNHLLFIFIFIFIFIFKFIFIFVDTTGLLDADVYGPSLPVLIHPTDPTVRRSSLGEGMVQPISHEGVKFLSLGFVSPKV